MGCLFWAAWIQTKPTVTMWIFANGTKPTETAGALANNQLPVMTLTIEDDDIDDSNDKVRRNCSDNDEATAAMATAATDIPAGRTAMEDGMAAMSVNAMSAGMTTTSMAPTAKHVQFYDQPLRQLVCKLKDLNINIDTTSDSKSEEPEESVDLAFDHRAELLCFTMGIS